VNTIAKSGQTTIDGIPDRAWSAPRNARKYPSKNISTNILKRFSILPHHPSAAGSGSILEFPPGAIQIALCRRTSGILTSEICTFSGFVSHGIASPNKGTAA
jgi:hypothetical protein